jgi:hypothetical protein
MICSWRGQNRGKAQAGVQERTSTVNSLNRFGILCNHDPRTGTLRMVNSGWLECGTFI